MRPNIDGFVVQLEGAEDAVQGGAFGVTVPRHDAIFPEDLQGRKSQLNSKGLAIFHFILTCELNSFLATFISQNCHLRDCFQNPYEGMQMIG